MTSISLAHFQLSQDPQPQSWLRDGISEAAEKTLSLRNRRMLTARGTAAIPDSCGVHMPADQDELAAQARALVESQQELKDRADSEPSLFGTSASLDEWPTLALRRERAFSADVEIGSDARSPIPAVSCMVQKVKKELKPRPKVDGRLTSEHATPPRPCPLSSLGSPGRAMTKKRPAGHGRADDVKAFTTLRI